MKRIFIAGTGTEVGKTFIACALARHLTSKGERVGVYKPVASGCLPFAESGLSRSATGFDSTREDTTLVSTDAVELWASAGKPRTLDSVCPQRFQLPLAPDEAARREGRQVDEPLLTAAALDWTDYCDTLIIEGAGGLFSPVSDRMLNIDLLCKLQPAELVLVAPNRLGAIHEVLATLRAAAAEHVTAKLLYLNQRSPAQGVSSDPPTDTSVISNAAQIAHWFPGLTIVPVRNGEAEIMFDAT